MHEYQMETEWRAWGAVCAELAKRGIVMNEGKHNPLAAALRRWAEEMAELRLGQERELTLEVLNDVRQEYPKLPLMPDPQGGWSIP